MINSPIRLSTASIRLESTRSVFSAAASVADARAAWRADSSSTGNGKSEAGSESADWISGGCVFGAGMLGSGADDFLPRGAASSRTNSETTAGILHLPARDSLVSLVASAASMRFEFVADAEEDGLSARIVPDCFSIFLTSSKPAEDRKSTRLNSSHPSISYAVFCLKKKT